MPSIDVAPPGIIIVAAITCMHVVYFITLFNKSVMRMIRTGIKKSQLGPTH